MRALTAIERCISFAETIGIKARLKLGYGQRHKYFGFLPGIEVRHGTLLVYSKAILGYDDVLHELGHLAILPAVIRRHADGDVDLSTRASIDAYCEHHPLILSDTEENQTYRAILQAGETEATAWGFAAQIHLGLPPRLHLMMQDGGSFNWREATADEIADEIFWLSHGKHFGVHGLAAAGMTTTKTFPKMLRWVQP